MSGPPSLELCQIDWCRLMRILNTRYFVALLLRMTIGAVVVSGWWAFAVAQEPKLVVNEVMANEPGSATSLEWVELVVWPDGVEGTVGDFDFVDGADTTHFGERTRFFPGEYVVLASKRTGPSSFEEFWGNNSGHWGDADTEDFVLLAAKMSLRNDADTVEIIYHTGDVSRMFWTTAPEDGVSIERIRPSGEDRTDNFAPCKDPARSTPGRANSVLPSANDLRIESVNFNRTLSWPDPIAFAVEVANAGIGQSQEASLTLLEDRTPFQAGFDAMTVFTTSVPRLNEGETTSVSSDWIGAAPGIHNILFAIHIDEDTVDFEYIGTIAVRHSQPLVIITEFLANPDGDAGPGEWVEICNQAEFAVDMRSTGIGDTHVAGPIPSYAGRIPPGVYWVLAEDESAFRAFYQDFSGLVFQVYNWPSLNNDGDLIRLLGTAGEIIDSVRYENLYDNNRSVERLTLSPAFATAEDWVASVDPSGATPGRANSVNRELAGPLQVSVSPNPIYLSRANVAEIEYRLEIGAQLTLKIFDRSGQLVRTIADETPSATGSMMWDGTDDDGAAVRPGAYVLLARSDPGGNVVKKVIVVGP